MSEYLNIEQVGTTAIVTLKRPDRENTLSGDVFNALRKTALKLTDAPPKAVILTGTDDLFSGGLDLHPDNPIIARMEALTRAGDTYALAELAKRLRSSIDLFGRINCPVVAAIEGKCHGAGFQLALACDIRIASKEATFALPETSYGALPFMGGMVRLSRLIGHSRTTDVVLSGRTIDAETMERWGVVNRVVPAGQAIIGAHAFLAKVAKNSPTATKHAVLGLRQLSQDAVEAFEVESETGARTLAAGDLTEGVLAHLQGRDPKWK